MTTKVIRKTKWFILCYFYVVFIESIYIYIYPSKAHLPDLFIFFNYFQNARKLIWKTHSNTIHIKAITTIKVQIVVCYIYVWMKFRICDCHSYFLRLQTRNRKRTLECTWNGSCVERPWSTFFLILCILQYYQNVVKSSFYMKHIICHNGMYICANINNDGFWC